MRVLLIGGPGSGKGTQAKVLARHFGIAHISSGELIRQHIANGTPIGRRAAEYVERGDLVPDDIMMEILPEAVESASRDGGYVLDGFPRTVDQAKALEPFVDIAVYLEVPPDQLVERVQRRSQSAGRSDDTSPVTRRRIEVFNELTPPLLDYYAARGALLRIDGSRSIEEVSAAIIAELEKARDR